MKIKIRNEGGEVVALVTPGMTPAQVEATILAMGVETVEEVPDPRCDTCKWWMRSKYFQDTDGYCESMSMACGPGFGCVRWEEK